MINRKLAALLAVAPFALALPTAAYRQYVPSPSFQAITTGINEVWDCSDPNADNLTEVSFAIADDGKIYDSTITRWSKNEQFNAECLEAVCSLSPVTPSNSHNGFLEHRTIRFCKNAQEPRIEPRYDASDVKEYLRNHPEPQNTLEKFVVVHKIPLDVLRRYPGLFTREELFSSENLIEIKGNVGRDLPNSEGQRQGNPQFVGTIGHLYAFWSDFFAENPKATKEQIIEHAQFASTAAQ